MQALLIRALLEYSQSTESWLPYGLSLVAGIFATELIRSWSLALMWAVNYRTAARLRGAALTFAFQKILRLRSTKDVSAGEVGVGQHWNPIPTRGPNVAFFVVCLSVHILLNHLN